MKLKWNENMTRRTVSGIIIAAVGIVLFFALQNLNTAGAGLSMMFTILSPFIWGLSFAFLLNLPMNFIETRLQGKIFKKKPRPKLLRTLCLVIAILLTLVFLVLLFAMLIPQLIDSATTLGTNIPTYIRDLVQTATQLMEKYNVDSQQLLSLIPSTEKLIEMATDFLSFSVPGVVTMTQQVVSGVMNVFVGFIICVYFLMSKELFFAQTKKVLYAVFPKKFTDKTIEITRLCNKTFTGFISGKIIDSLIVGILCFVILWVLRMPYALLISVIVGVTNVIPFFGPIIGAVPSALIVLIVDPPRMILLLIVIILLQQFDGNILGPRILGDSTGLPALWVMFAIFVGGGLFGFIGMIISVPLFAVIYTLFKALVDDKLKKKDMPTNVTEYKAEGGAGDAPKQ